MRDGPQTPARACLDEFVSLPRWVAWQAENRKGKTTKIPYHANGVGRAASDDPSTWGTREEAESSAEKLPRPLGVGGIGLMLGDLGDGRALGGVDLDACRDVGGTLAPFAREVIDRLDSYTEVSPSGTGAKLFFLYDAADLPKLRDAMQTEYGKAWRAPGGGEHGPAIEMYLGNRYFAVTREQLPDTPQELRRVDATTLIWLIHDAGPRLKGPAAAFDSRHPSRSEAAFALGARLKRKGVTFEEMCHALREHPETGAWVIEKGEASGGRELRRIWEKAEGPSEWPQPPITLATQEAAPPPLLPVADIFPPRWAGWINDAAEAKGAAPDYVALSMLAGAGALIGNSRWGNPWEGWQEPSALFVALVGNPSASKSPALDTLVDPLTRIEAKSNDDWNERQRKHATDKAAAAERHARWEADVKLSVKNGTSPPLRPLDAADPDTPQRRRVYSTDPTVAKAERMSAAAPRGLLLVRDELAGWLAGMDRFANGAGSDRAFYLTAYGGRAWTPDRVKDGDREVSVPHLTWGIIGGIQPDRLASLMLAGDDDGLTARFIYTWPALIRPRRPGTGLNIGRAEEWLTRLQKLPWNPPEPILVPFVPEAQAILQEWREAAAMMEENASGLLLSWLGKLPGFAVRLATIFAYLAWCEHGVGDPPSEVQEVDILRALTFLDSYAIPMARRCFGEAAMPEAERDARVLARWFLKCNPLPKVVNARALRRMAGGPAIKTSERILAALNELAALALVRPAPARDGGAGRLRGDWAVNPRLQEG